MTERHIGRDELRDLYLAIELVILADDRHELHEELLVPAAVAWVTRQPRNWRRRELVAHLLRACAPFTTLVQ